MSSKVTNRLLFGDAFVFIRNGKSIKQDKSGEGLPITRIETISFAEIDPDRVGYAGLEERDCKDWLLQNGDILFSHINSIEHIGKCAVYRGVPEKLVHGMNLLCFRPNTKLIYPEYAKYLIRSNSFRGKLSNSVKKSVNQASVSISDIREIPIDLPPLPEQKRIAAILDSADAIRQKRKAAIAKLDDLAQSVFMEMFGDPINNDQHFPVVRLADLTSKIGSGATPTGGDASYIREGITLIRSMNIYDNLFEYRNLAHISSAQAEKLSNVIVEENDVLLNITGASVCRCSIVPTSILPARVNQHVAILRPKPGMLNSEYLASLITYKKYKEFLLKQARSNGATREALTKSQIENLPIPLPSIHLQDKFSSHLASILAIRYRNSIAINKEESLFSSLQHRAFAGEL